MDYIFKLRRLTDAVGTQWRDGVKMELYNGRLHQIGGWNVDGGSDNQHWVSDDGGTTWTQLSDGPWGVRHCGGCVVYRNRIWIWCGDNNADLWWYTDADGWNEQVTVLNGLTSREHSTFLFKDGYAYVMMGTTYGNITLKNNNIYRINLRADSDWEWELYSLVSGDMANIDSACLVNFKGYTWFFGGGRLAGETPPYFTNLKIWKSLDLITWELAKAEEPLFNSGIWGDAVANEEYIFYISGSNNVNSLTADNRLMISDDGVNWNVHQEPIQISGRHATAMCIIGRSCIISRGYQKNDCWLLRHIASQYRCDIGILND